MSKNKHPALSHFQSHVSAVVLDKANYQEVTGSSSCSWRQSYLAPCEGSEIEIPPGGNTGGNSELPSDWDLCPRPSVPGDAAFIDWLRFTFPVTAYDTEENTLDEHRFIMRLFSDLEVYAELFYGGEMKSGRYFYDRAYSFGGQSGGFVAVGGNRGTCCVELSGACCAMVRDWKEFQAWIARLGGKITRVDLTRDCLEGEYTVADARAWYDAGGFTIRRPPSARFIDDCGSGKGCTFYVGARENGKMLRVYDKGKQLGDRDSSWVRFELELLSQDREIPIDVLTSPGPYMAGAYPALEWVNQSQNRIATIAKTEKISYEKLVTEAKKAYGRLIHYMRNIGLDASQIVAELIETKGYPKRLLSIPGIDLPFWYDDQGFGYAENCGNLRQSAAHCGNVSKFDAEYCPAQSIF